MMLRFALVVAALAAPVASPLQGQSTEPAPVAPPDAAAPPSSSTASPQAGSPMLWQNIRYGMTANEVRALYPASATVTYRDNRITVTDYQVTPQCRADVHIHFPQGTVDRVQVRGDGSMGGRCSDTVLTALSSRYGEALSRDRREASILAREGTVYVWNRDGVTLRFQRFTNGVFGGGGLGRASWELQYTIVQTDVAL